MKRRLLSYYVEFSDHYDDLSENYIDMSDNDVDLSDNKLTRRWQLLALKKIIVRFLATSCDDIFLTNGHK